MNKDLTRFDEAMMSVYLRTERVWTVEALILGEEWHPLVSEQEREVARHRLADYGYGPTADGGNEKCPGGVN